MSAAAASPLPSPPPPPPPPSSGAVRVQEEEEEPGLVQGDPRDGADEDPELEATKAREREMEEEAAKLKELQAEARRQTTPSPGSREEQMQADARSIYVGNVDYGATAQELEAHFQACGSVNRVTILCDRFSGHPKGFAYVEFSEEESARTALALDESLFRGRQVKVAPKRTIRPGVSSSDRGFPRARFGARFRARPPDCRPCPSPFHGAVNSRPRGRVSRGRARGRSSWYSPY